MSQIAATPLAGLGCLRCFLRNRQDDHQKKQPRKTTPPIKALLLR